MGQNAKSYSTINSHELDMADHTIDRESEVPPSERDPLSLFSEHEPLSPSLEDFDR